MKTNAPSSIRMLSFSALGLGALAFFLSFSQAAPVFEPDNQPIGYVGQIALTNVDVSSGKEFVFSIDYRAPNWNGNLHKYSVSSIGTISEKDEWLDGAASAIGAQDYDSERFIVTMEGSHRIPFRWSKLSASQQSMLDPEASETGTSSSSVLNYIRGDRSKESPSSPGFRHRLSVLGDIIHSTPLYCPSSLCAADTVFFGANDGMLHAIDAKTGRGRFAYIPSLLIPKLNALTSPDYKHRYFVDGRMALRKIGERTILVGALGAGGKGLFALDISNAAPASESDAAMNLLWEITTTSSGFGNLGYTYGQPNLVKLRNGSISLIAANGYQNSGNGHAVLYLIDPLTGKKTLEIDTSDYGGSGTAASPNGLSSPSMWSTQYDGKIDTAYAGDIDGNLWRFDLLNGTAKKLYASQPAQAITTAPALIKHPLGGAMVIFVTGRMLASDDSTNRMTHYAYGIWDGAPDSNLALLEQTLTEAEYKGISPNIRVRFATNHLPNWLIGHHKGWKTPLPIGGERLVGDGIFVTNGVFQFISTNPAVNTGKHRDDRSAYGENWWMQINALTGGNVGTVVFDLNRDKNFTSADQVTIDKTTRFPVGMHLGGGTRSQMTPMVTESLHIYHSNCDTNFFLSPTSSVIQIVSQVPGKPGVHQPKGIIPGGTVNGGVPNKEGEVTQGDRLGRINWQEIQQ